MFEKFVDLYFDDAIDLKKAFSVTEKKEWDSLTVILELNVQIGHYTSLLHNDVYSVEIGRNINNKADELSDIILQIFTLMWKLNIDKEDLINMDYNIKSEEIAILDLLTLLGQVSETILEDNEYRHYKERVGFYSHRCFLIEKVSKMMTTVLKICEINNICIMDEFKNMCVNAKKFLDSYEVK